MMAVPVVAGSISVTDGTPGGLFGICRGGDSGGVCVGRRTHYR